MRVVTHGTPDAIASMLALLTPQRRSAHWQMNGDKEAEEEEPGA